MKSMNRFIPSPRQHARILTSYILQQRGWDVGLVDGDAKRFDVTWMAKLFEHPWELVGLGCFFAWYQILRQQMMPDGLAALLPSIGNRQLLETLIALSLILLVVLNTIRPTTFRPKIWLAVGIAGCVATLAFFIVNHGAVGPFKIAVLAVGCLAICQLTLLWCGQALSTGTDRTIAHLLLSVFIGRALPLVGLTGWNAALPMCAALLPLASAAALAASTRPFLQPVERNARNQQWKPGKLTNPRLVLLVASVILLGIAMGAFKQNLGSTGIDAPASIRPPIGTAVLVLHCAVSVLLLLFGRARLCLATYRATLCITAFGCLFALINLPDKTLSSACILWAQFMFIGLTWSIAPEITVHIGGRTRYIVGWYFAAFYASTAAGPFVYELLADAASGAFDLAVPPAAALLACVLLVHFYLFREQDVLTVLHQHQQNQLESTRLLLEKCQEVKGLYALSDRELTIVTKWVSGETAPAIASDLFISESTVRTHVRHIYEKMGVNSRSSLIDLVQSGIDRTSNPWPFASVVQKVSLSGNEREPPTRT